MRLSESIRRGILETAVGGIINKFKIKSKRRDTLFFEELMARYIHECEKKGFGAEIRNMGEEWGFLTSRAHASGMTKKIPPVLLFNVLIGKIWHNLGLLDDLQIEKNNGILKIKTKNEAITRFIGQNEFMPGFYAGTIEALLDTSVDSFETTQGECLCEYIFKLDRTPAFFEGRSKDTYIKLNGVNPAPGYTLADAFRRKMFVSKGNRIYFRGKSVLPVENTIFHIVGNANILHEKIAEISYDFFKEIINEKATCERKVIFLKTLFQMMGWGIIRILVETDGRILIEIKNPPHGLISEDNWTYLFRTFLGYLWLIDKKLEIVNIKKTAAGVSVEYAP